MEKKLFSIEELAKYLAVESGTISKWEKEFNINPTKSINNGRRFYTKKHIKQFEKIKASSYYESNPMPEEIHKPNIDNLQTKLLILKSQLIKLQALL